MHQGTIVMNSKEQKMYQLGLEVLGGRLTLVEYSCLIQKSYRQCQRIIQKIQTKNMFGVKHGNLGRTPKNKTDAELKGYVISLLRTRYFDFNLTHFREKLLENEGINIGRETLRKWAKSEELVKRAKRRNLRRAHKPRPRMPRSGMLIQFDGSEHDWFSGLGPVCTLLGGIDDATGEVLNLEFFPAEDTFACLKTVHDIVEKWGVPEAFYVDQGKCFGKLNREQTSTQLGRALDELGCKMILARSPQAKGRIERLWGTLQDRLVAELRLHGINRMPSANQFLRSQFISAYNQKFAIPPRDTQPAWQPLGSNQNLRGIFSIKEPRKIGPGNVFSVDQQMYVAIAKQDLRYRTVLIRWYWDDTMDFEVMGQKIEAQKVESKIQATQLRNQVA